MRSEKEMLDLILNVAENDDNIRAVIMNGSRVNSNAKKDPFQDFDIVYLVRDVEPYKRNKDFIKPFGDLMIMQTPEDMTDPPPENDGHYTYLMQFLDGRRIDLSLYSLENISALIADSLTVVLLDKDHLIPELPLPSDRDYLPQKPTAKLFEDCCNEFWWVSPYVAKGLWRDELTYTKHILDVFVREQLMKMLVWYVGVQTDFQKSPGKLGKYFKQFLDPELWKLLECTYTDSQPEHIWEALFAMGDLFRQTGQSVAKHFGFNYPEQDDKNVNNYLGQIRRLPKDAETIY
ncbi:MAG TPA: aminoglycoside 6-adenylyltransferase [Anaerolineales bacterium]|nr:aminoglycoside 6-adenylyltransferase [Anaerolineales bacterium]